MQIGLIETAFMSRFIELGIQLVKKLPNFYETLNFNEIF